MLGAVIHGMVSLGGGVKSGGHVLLFDILSGKLYKITNMMLYLLSTIVISSTLI